jgi:hypothetical protein
MPIIIPRAERRVERQPLPGVSQTVRATPAAFGAPQAQAISELGSAIIQAGEAIERRDVAAGIRAGKERVALQKAQAEVQDRKDKMEANDLFLEFQGKWRTDKSQFMDTQRREADGVTTKATEWTQTTKDELFKKATSDNVRFNLDVKLNPKITTILDKVSGHEVGQLRIAEVELNDNLYANAVLDAGSPDSIQSEILDTELQAREALRIKTQGMDSETAKKVTTEGMSAFHTAVIDGKIESNLAFASSYFDEVKSEMTPEERETASTEIKEATTEQSARELAKNIELTVDDNNEWNNAVDTRTKDIEVRKQAKVLLDAKKKDEAAHDAELIRRERNDVLTDVFNARNLTDALLKANNAKDPANKEKAIAVAESRFARKNRDVETNPNVQADALDRINAGEFTEIADLLQFYPDLSSGDYNNLISRLQSHLTEARTGKPVKEGAVKYNTAKTAYETVKERAYDVEDDAKEFTFMLDALDKEAQKLGRDLTASEARRAAAITLVDGEAITGGAFGDPDMTLFEATQENVSEIWIPNINDDDVDGGKERSEINASLERLGLSSSEENRETLFRLYKKASILKLELSPQQIDLFNSILIKVK